MKNITWSLGRGDHTIRIFVFISSLVISTLGLLKHRKAPKTYNSSLIATLSDCDPSTKREMLGGKIFTSKNTLLEFVYAQTTVCFSELSSTLIIARLASTPWGSPATVWMERLRTA